MPKKDGTPTKREQAAVQADQDRRARNARHLARLPDHELVRVYVHDLHFDDLTEALEAEAAKRGLTLPAARWDVEHGFAPEPEVSSRPMTDAELAWFRDHGLDQAMPENL